MKSERARGTPWFFKVFWSFWPSSQLFPGFPVYPSHLFVLESACSWAYEARKICGVWQVVQGILGSLSREQRDRKSL